MRFRLGLFALLLLALAPCSLLAEIGTIDVTPAATLLFPHFEVDLDNVQGRTTIITIQAATATATLAHVTLWTDLGIPIYAFDVYLTGFDMQAINLRDIFNGNLPGTADDGQDPSDTISNQGPFSQDINYPGATGPCGSGPEYLIPAEVLADLRAAHTGEANASTGRYAGRYLGDNVARGYVTVDVVNQCCIDLPSQPGYFSGVAVNQNWLLGEYLLIDPQDNFMKAESAVHLEASEGLLGQRTFYGRLASAAGGIDRREPLPSTWAVGALTDSITSPNTELMVWRDPGPGAPTAPFGNPSVLPAPFPMPVSDATAFDDESRVTPLAATLMPFATTSTRLVPDLFNPGTKLGWAFLDLNVGTAPADVRQSWVTVARTWEGRFATATNGVVLDPPPPTLRVVEASCPEGRIELSDAGWGSPVMMLWAPNGTTVHVNYRLRLIDTASRDVTAQTNTGSFAGVPPSPATVKTASFPPGEFDTAPVFGTHDFVATWSYSNVQFFVPGVAGQTVTYMVSYMGEE